MGYKRLIVFLLGFLFFVSYGGGGGSSTQPSSGGGSTQPGGGGTPTTQNQKTLIAMYIVGSDLESGGNAATSDLLEIAQGLQQVSHSDLQIVIAFGGSSKQGWQGVKYMDKSCLLQDIQNTQLGDDNCYLYTNTNANMGDPATLTHFLNHLKNNYSSYDKKILIFWDHGGAYTGFGQDENYNGDGLDLSEMKQAMSSAGMSFDLIGFDACLMASLEVAKALSPYGKYLVASEEIEPGHGWYYTPVISFIAQNPNASTVDIAKKIVDSYMSHPNAQSGKTLSVVDLSQINTVVQALDNLTAKLDDPNLGPDVQTFGKAVANSRDYGRYQQQNISFTMDLKDFAIKVKSVNTSLQQEADNLINAINSAVVYSKHDGTRPNSYGLSIFNPKTVSWYNKKYTQQVTPSQTWFTFLGKVYTEIMGDNTPPNIMVRKRIQWVRSRPEVLEYATEYETKYSTLKIGRT